MSETIKVRIYATQRVHYSQVVDMTVDEFGDYEAMARQRDRGADKDMAELVERYIDLDDASDADRFEDIEVSPIVSAT